MTREEAVIWIINLSADLGKIEHQSLWFYDQALDEIRELLEVDAVPVVRCKDCRFNHKVSVVGCPMLELIERKDLDFCSYGEKVTE